jgi:hypothetical protein
MGVSDNEVLQMIFVVLNAVLFALGFIAGQAR